MNQPWAYMCSPSSHFKDIKIKEQTPPAPFSFVKFSLLFSIFWSLCMAVIMALLIFKRSPPYKARLGNPQPPSFNPEPVSRLSSLCMYLCFWKTGCVLRLSASSLSAEPWPPAVCGAPLFHLVAWLPFVSITQLLFTVSPELFSFGFCSGWPFPDLMKEWMKAELRTERVTRTRPGRTGLMCPRPMGAWTWGLFSGLESHSLRQVPARSTWRKG